MISCSVRSICEHKPVTVPSHKPVHPVVFSKMVSLPTVISNNSFPYTLLSCAKSNSTIRLSSPINHLPDTTERQYHHFSHQIFQYKLLLGCHAVLSAIGISRMKSLTITEMETYSVLVVSVWYVSLDQ